MENWFSGSSKRLSVMSLVALLSSSSCGDTYNETTNENYYPGGENGNGNSSACNSSPMTGRYLWNTGNCESGMVTPVDPESCTADLRYDDSGQTKATVNGTRVEFPLENGNTYSLTLVKSFSCEEIKDQHKETYPERCDTYQCYLDSDSEVWVGKTSEGVSMIDNLWRIMDKPWPGKGECRISPFYVIPECGSGK